MVSALCPPVETLRRYSQGDLDEDTAELLDRHLAACETCLARLDQLSTVDELFGELRDRSASVVTPSVLHHVVNLAEARVAADAIAGVGAVGGYTLLEEIGRGGMGQVYRATHPRLPVDVAIKLLRPGHDTDRLRRRFELERETLARMDHPNIAKVYDAGISADGRPFIAMEYVRGVTLGTFLATTPCETNARLELFRQICAAVQHAHQKGVIHRDLKPSNVLLMERDGLLIPKVIDFGVACEIDSKTTGFTDDGFAVGTLQYMSPEQTQRGPGELDTRSDVFALGVMLYEIVAGKTPLAAIGGQRKPPPEAMRMIREVDPPPPGQAATDASNNRIRQELDWIVLKAIEKEPGRRYETVAAFADDIRRLLNDEPVEAAPPSRLYRLRKFARRNRGAIAAGGLVALALCGGIATTTVQLFRAREAEAAAKSFASEAGEKRDLAQQAMEQSELDRIAARKAEQDARSDRKRAVEAEADSAAFNKFLVDHVLVAPRPRHSKFGFGRTVTLVEALEVAEPKIEEIFANRPIAEAKARIALGETWLYHSRFAEAEKQYRRAQAILDTRPDARELALQCRQHIVVLLHNTGRYRDALAQAEVLLPQTEAAFGSDSSGTQTLRLDLAGILLALGRTTESLAIARSVLEQRKAQYPADHRLVLQALAMTASALSSSGQTDEAAKFYEEVLDRRRRTLGPDNRDTISAMNDVASMRLRQNRPAEAATILEDALVRAREALGDTGRTTLTIQSNLGSAYVELNRIPEALKLLEDTYRVCLAELGPAHTSTLNVASHLATVYRKQRKFDLAIPIYRDILRIRTESFGIDHSVTLTSKHNLGIAYEYSGDFLAAIPHLEYVANHHLEKRGRLDFQTANAIYFLAQALIALDDYDRAGPWLERIAEYATSPDGMKTNIGRYLRQLLGSWHVRNRRYPLAENYLASALSKAERERPTTASSAIALSDLGVCLLAKREFETAEQSLVRAHRTIEAGYRSRNIYLTYDVLRQSHRRLIDLYTMWNKPERVAEWKAFESKLKELAPSPRPVDR
jgi:tetratricopeptide (TPR) repeat protein